MAKDKKTPLRNETLFSAEEWSSITPGELWYKDPKREQPVTVLGHTFKNDDERREWFRTELRKKLPELKQMEGYPIGEDDDIINLSDPPYYTACPNPWLNDFIAEWEQDKKKLIAEGKRDANAVVAEPYASDVSEGKNNPIYMAHSYHTKVPHPAIMRYILHYTQPGDIVFDGFAGTGMAGVAANLCGSKVEVDKLNEDNAKIGVRHGICSDLSPIATLIAASYNRNFSPTAFEANANAVLSKVEDELGWMFETEADINVGNKTNKVKGKITSVIWSDVFSCPNCGEEFKFGDLSVDFNNKKFIDNMVCPKCGTELTKSNLNKVFCTKYDNLSSEITNVLEKKPLRIYYTINGKRACKEPNNSDLQLLDKIDALNIDNFKVYKIPHGDKTDGIIKSNHLKYTYQFYTKRSIIYLNRVYDLVKDDTILLAWLTSCLTSTTEMNKFRFSGTGINAGTLYIPSLNWEFVPYYTLKRKIHSFVESYYEYRGNSVVNLESATNIYFVGNDSVDYIFTDPPFGANIMYSELNCILESWIHVFENNKEEAVVNKTQHKTLFDYQSLMWKSFREYYRILKPGKWMTIEFSNTSASVWNSIQNSLQSVGFIVANVASLDKKQGSYNAVNSTTAVKQDLVISCYKPSDELTQKMVESNDKRQNVWDFIGEHLQHLPVHIERGNATTTVIERSPKILYDRLISYYVQHGYNIPMDAQQFQQGLRERFIERDGMFFNAKQAAEYEEKKAHTSEFVPMGLIISDEANGIEWLKHQLKEPKTYQEISPEWMAAINGVKKGDVLPELKEILEENFIEDEQGKWHVPDMEKAIDMEKLHHKSLMHEFNLYKEQAQKPRARIKEVRVEALREGFKECFKNKDFQTILLIADKIPQNILTEDEQLLQYYDIASMRA